ncbi:hypothetical protein Rsub_05360 [Raphidocelis subcapitata]|uniref:Uncharacterized protein n=1 Tax=Raphidocelis subcapitata TaxID=307507 RepID=A0A2V0P514_9CHLO|nr:hypothetical protein Rsub_05360 [Raphidocelis subcapitata]|eukprot:GBF92277.1 hypothetical protein Rsub_05360 [Raphidocelis subcapitata]
MSQLGGRTFHRGAQAIDASRWAVWVALLVVFALLSLEFTPNDALMSCTLVIVNCDFALAYLSPDAGPGAGQQLWRRSTASLAAAVAISGWDDLMEVLNDWLSQADGSQQKWGWPLLAVYSLWVLVKALRGGAAQVRVGDSHKDNV